MDEDKFTYLMKKHQKIIINDVRDLSLEEAKNYFLFLSVNFIGKTLYLIEEEKPNSFDENLKEINKYIELTVIKLTEHEKSDNLSENE